MKNKIILSALFSGLIMIGINAQEKKVNVSDGNIKTETVLKKNETIKTEKTDKKLAHPEANVNYKENVSEKTLGKDEITKKSLSYEGMVVGEKRPSIPFKLDEASMVKIQFKSDNPNALYYVVDRLENLMIPATEKEFNDKLPAGEYFLMVGLTPEAVKNQEKATYGFLIEK